MNKTSLRKIKVGNEKYLWKRGHLHLEKFVHSKCVEKVIVFLDGYKNSPLHLLFREDDNLTLKSDITIEKWCVGHPDDGVIWLYRKTSTPQTTDAVVNLNRPGVIAQLIKYYVRNGWNPRETKKPLIIKDALKLIEQLDLPRGINNENENNTNST